MLLWSREMLRHTYSGLRLINAKTESQFPLLISHSLLNNTTSMSMNPSDTSRHYLAKSNRRIEISINEFSSHEVEASLSRLIYSQICLRTHSNSFTRTTNITLVCLTWRSPEKARLFDSTIILPTSELLFLCTNPSAVFFAPPLLRFLFCFRRVLSREQLCQPIHGRVA